MNNTIIALLSLFVLWIIWRLLWKKYALDSFRESLFSLRGDLFDLADDNPDFNFENPLYQKWETIINRTIQYAHTMDMLDFQIFSALVKIKKIEIGKCESSLQKELKRLIESIDQEKIRRQLADIKKKYEICIKKHIITNSIVLLIAVIISTIPYFLKCLFTKRKNKRPIDSTKQHIKDKYFKHTVKNIEMQAAA